jgi:DNA-binding NtrC family response regulator
MKILIADDDPNLRKVLTIELSGDGYEVQATDSGVRALELIEKGEPDVVILDLNMPGLNGMEVLKQIKSLESSVEVIVLTGYATVSTAVEAMKLGACDFLTKPFNVESLKAVIEKAYERRALLRENLLLKSQLKRQSQPQVFITRSPLLHEILENIDKIALSDFPVLISGESGTGKELFSRAVHEASRRAEGPFIPINCAAIPENMLESELFGHEKGAFTGAHARKLGLLEIANGGILFLDEIGDLPSLLQGKLLRVIETGLFFRVGGVKEVRTDVKFVSATNKDIKTEVDKGSFRGDLYYRISALSIFIPPLRERKEDIPLLVDHFSRINPAFKNKGFSPEALDVLCEYGWPGNVRELQNVVHRTLLLSKKDTIDPEDLPADLSAAPRPSSSRLEDVEREHILKVFKEVGHKGKAAEILGMDPKTLYRKLLSYGVEE